MSILTAILKTKGQTFVRMINHELWIGSSRTVPFVGFFCIDERFVK